MTDEEKGYHRGLLEAKNIIDEVLKSGAHISGRYKNWSICRGMRMIITDKIDNILFTWDVSA